MKCASVQRSISGYLDQVLPASDAREMARHIEACSNCSTFVEQHRRVKRSAMSLPRVTVPKELTTKLRVMASRESLRRRRHADIRALVNSWREIASINMNNLMRPLAAPVAGGLLSAVFLFTLLAPQLDVPVFRGIDVPTTLVTEATVRNPVIFSQPWHGDIVLEAILNERGYVVDYSVTKGQAALRDPAIRSALESNLLFTQFNVPTAFGRPLRGKVRVTFSGTSEIDVIG